jgi:predicted permease
VTPRRHRPPLTLRFAARLLPQDAREEILGDLIEHWARVVSVRRWPVRAAWAWRQPLVALGARLRFGAKGSARSRVAVVRRSGLGVSLLDVQLALRMLLKQPGLTLVAIFALAIGIPVGLLPLHVLDSLTKPPPVDNGEEIVIVRNYDREESRTVGRPLHDFVQWRAELSSFEGLGMCREELLNINSEDGRAAPVRGAEVTASILSLTHVPPLLGRTLNEADEVIGAPDVVVIGYDLWQSRLAGDSNIVGSTIRIGTVPHMVVGVMPEGFLFPVRDHLWLPFRYDPLEYERGSGPAGTIVGRLADGVSIDEARNEIELLGQRMADQFPDTHAQLRPQVLPYTDALMDIDGPEVRPGVFVAQIVAFLLLVLACGNVGILVLARAATRTGELAIRTALGASRVRILSQLFIESLLLAVLAAGVGLLVLQAVATTPDILIEQLPYWIDFEVSLETTVRALSLAVVSAALAGVVPALKATGKNVHVSMQRATGGGSGIRFGKGYSALLIGEVALAVWILAIGFTLPHAVSEPGGLGIQTDQYLFATLRIPRVDHTTSGEPSEGPKSVGRVRGVHEELARRLSAEPSMGPVAIASELPGMPHTSYWMEVEGIPPAPGSAAPAHSVNVARVDVGYFDALDQPILRGRNFNRGDLGEDRSAVIVNTSFVDSVLGGRNPLGRRVRYWRWQPRWLPRAVSPPGQDAAPWSFEIVGVVGPLGMSALNASKDQGLYHVFAPGELHPASFAVRVGNDPESAIPRVRSIVTEIDGSALLEDPMALDRASDEIRRFFNLGTYLVAFMAGIAVVLSAACLYALMSFTVAERTRECGIRTALGAQRTKIVSAIGKRAFIQLSVGVTIGAALSALMLSEAAGFNSPLLNTSNWPRTVGMIAAFVVVVGMLACVKPTLRAIRIQPAETLKD